MAVDGRLYVLKRNGLRMLAGTPSVDSVPITDGSYLTFHYYIMPLCDDSPQSLLLFPVHR